MEHYTIMVVGAETSPVRRYEFSSQALLTWRRLGVALAVAFVIGVGDYVRLRIDQVELDELRVEVTHQRQKIQNFEITLADVEQRLSRIREFERKVRIIANLPGAKSEGGESEFGAFRVRGVEQQGEVFKPTHLPVRVGYVARPTGSPAADGTSVPSDLQRLAGDDALLLPEPQVTVELREEVERLGHLAAAREDSLMKVVSRLQDKRQRLLSTPSIWPARGWLTSTFGPRISPFTGRHQFHGGVDVAGERGTEIVATADGRVTYVGTKGPLGNTVIIDHGYGVRTLYGHAEALFVERGARVERGTRIASLGSSGRSTGPHLHYAVERRRRAVDPLDFIFD